MSNFKLLGGSPSTAADEVKRIPGKIKTQDEDLYQTRPCKARALPLKAPCLGSFASGVGLLGFGYATGKVPGFRVWGSGFLLLSLGFRLEVFRARLRVLLRFWGAFRLATSRVAGTDSRRQVRN